MAHTYDELHGMTVAALREIAKGLEHDELHGYTTMHKEQLLRAVCHALGIEDHTRHEVVGVNKSRIKAQIRELKTQRSAALEAGDKAAFQATRKQIKQLKRKLRSATV